ncbi:MAG TPA: type II toxin-antitoxin system RelE/ParE family toxin [Rhodothermales bacterium]|nr:type II toxin-antitoxin system RelE/ParE family toxin [Rhodothermales bacterium]
MSALITPRARRDLLEIWEYIAVDSEREADALADEFGGVFSLIDDNPHMGRARNEIQESLRSFPLRSYVIFYTSAEEGIEVIRVLHARQDVEESFDS